MRCGWILGLVLLAGCHSPSSEGVSEGVSEGASEGAGRKNLLFLMFDDLRADLSVYGSECVSECGSENRATLTPHMDRLAARGVVFDHAYSTLRAVCCCCPSAWRERATALRDLGSCCIARTTSCCVRRTGMWSKWRSVALVPLPITRD
jgi:hypothetical protein